MLCRLNRGSPFQVCERSCDLDETNDLLHRVVHERRHKVCSNWKFEILLKQNTIYHFKYGLICWHKKINLQNGCGKRTFRTSTQQVNWWAASAVADICATNLYLHLLVREFSCIGLCCTIWANFENSLMFQSVERPSWSLKRRAHIYHISCPHTTL